MSKIKRPVTINKIKNPFLSTPRCISAEAKGVQYVSGFIPSLICGVKNEQMQFLDELPCSYSGKSIQSMNAKELKQKDSKLGDTLEARLEMNGLCLKTGLKPIDIYKNGESESKYTETHTDLYKVLIVGYKVPKLCGVLGRNQRTANLLLTWLGGSGNKLRITMRI